MVVVALVLWLHFLRANACFSIGILSSRRVRETRIRLSNDVERRESTRRRKADTKATQHGENDGETWERSEAGDRPALIPSLVFASSHRSEQSVPRRCLRCRGVLSMRTCHYHRLAVERPRMAAVLRHSLSVASSDCSSSRAADSERLYCTYTSLTHNTLASCLEKRPSFPLCRRSRH